MAKTEGTYIWVVYKNVFGHISTNFWPFFMIQRLTIRKKCAWVRSNIWWNERPVFFGFLIFRQTSQLATEKFQNLCNCNQWSGLLQLGSVRFRSFFQSSELDLWTLVVDLARADQWTKSWPKYWVQVLVQVGKRNPSEALEALGAQDFCWCWKLISIDFRQKKKKEGLHYV